MLPGAVTITIVKRSTTTVMGDSVTTEAEHEWDRCLIAPAGAPESSATYAPDVVERVDVYGPMPPVALSAGDGLIIGGQTFDVDGRMEDWTRHAAFAGVVVHALRGVGEDDES